MTADRLSAYRGRRDFEKTAEPAGPERVAASPHLRFVVQKHAARRLHFDLRLELDGVFRSFAVTRGPSLDPHDRRLAVEVEDHPLAYGDFEGVIPAGEYGGGTVEIWDRGFWTPDPESPPQQALEAGELKFSLQGERLKGGFVLLRMKKRAGRRDWLLIKRRDAYARDGADLSGADGSVASGRSLEEIAAGVGPQPRPFMTRRAGAKPALRTPADAVLARPPADAASAPRKAGATRKSSAPKKPAPPKSAGAKTVRILGVALSHPEKPLWPEAEDGAPVSKLELARYFEAAAPFMLEHVHGRPCSLLRAPEGISGEIFFQRRAGPGVSKLFDRLRLKGERAAYLQINRPEALIAAAQIAALELHPGNGAPGQPETPGRLVFDLDPGEGVSFAQIAAAARELRERLEALGLVAFCKTSGGKGMHVVTPLAPEAPAMDWPRAKAFTREICRRMAEDSPQSYVAEMAKRLREGKIFLDYLRNDLTATAVAPLSPRARPGGHVSMPIGWAEAEDGLDPARFTLRTALARLAASGAWRDYAEGARPLGPALARLGPLAPGD